MPIEIAGPWHDVTVRVDTFMTSEGERPGYSFDLEHTPECGGPGCLLETWSWPPEYHQIPGVGEFRVRYTAATGEDGLEWEL